MKFYVSISSFFLQKKPHITPSLVSIHIDIEWLLIQTYVKEYYMMLRNFSFVNEIKKHTMNFDYMHIIHVYFWTLFFYFMHKLKPNLGSFFFICKEKWKFNSFEFRIKTCLLLTDIGISSALISFFFTFLLSNHFVLSACNTILNWI